MAEIILLGLGPGDVAHLTQEAWNVLQASDELYVRTRQHPVVAQLPSGLQVHAFDALYEKAESFEHVYAQIVEQVLALGRRPKGVVYGVPGHPFVAEATGVEILRRARAAQIPVRVVEGLSFIEPTLTLLELDPFPRMTLVDALEVAAAHHPPFPPDAPALIAQLYSQPVAAEVKLTLMAVYPDEHPVKLVHGAGTQHPHIETLPLYAIDRSPHIGLLTSLCVPPLGPATAFEAFQEIIARLRAPDGCPWDRVQTHLSLRPYLLEEAYEALEALDAEDSSALQEELGDLLIQVVLHAQIASEEGEFRMADVLRQVHEKLVYRHPHVFGAVEVDGVEAVKENWARLKEAEKEGRGEGGKGVLEGVAASLPALARADALQQRAARVGFDWPDLEGVWAKVLEELQEVRAAPDPASRESELGDLLFAVVNLARWFHVDAESALRVANARFARRFARLEDSARRAGQSLSELSLEELDALWDAAKRE